MYKTASSVSYTISLAQSAISGLGALSVRKQKRVQKYVDAETAADVDTQESTFGTLNFTELEQSLFMLLHYHLNRHKY